MTDLLPIISIILNGLFAGGFFIQFVTIRSLRVKAKAEAEAATANTDSLELDNVNKAIKIWRDMAESFKMELIESRKNNVDFFLQVEGFRKEVARLNCTSNKILKLLNLINVENLEKIVEQIKTELNDKSV